MRRIDTNSEVIAKARLVLAVLILTAARLQAQDEAQSEEKPEAQSTRQIVVSLADRKLALVEDGAVKKIYPVAIGKATTPSPTGTFTIVNRVTNPTYYHPGQVIEPGPQNPLGTRWIGLNQKGYGIHGTNAPKSIGKPASHGCIRMAKKDLEELFDIVRPGDAVEIHADRDESVAAIFGGMAAPVMVASTSIAKAAEASTLASR